MKILGIETSCDETSVAVVEDGRKIIANLIASQVDVHRRFGGIVPEVASRQHMLALPSLLEQIFAETKLDAGELFGVAVTRGPGLAGSLLVGVNFAKGLAYAWNLKLIGINHIEAHIYANWLSAEEPPLPALCLVASGGHTELLLMEDHGKFKRLGETRDDAAGEAFDKVARLLGLDFPGGPAIERAALRGKPRFQLPRAWLRGTWDFSFSGLKTAVLHLLRSFGSLPYPEDLIADIAASFQEAVVDVLTAKAARAAEEFGARALLLAGGVACNKRLRELMISRSPVPVIYPPPVLCTDNAAMVAACAFFHFRKGEEDSWDLDVHPDLRL